MAIRALRISINIDAGGELWRPRFCSGTSTWDLLNQGSGRVRDIYTDFSSNSAASSSRSQYMGTTSTSTSAEKVSRFRFKTFPAFRSGELWYYFGPAFVASVAYIDPGNFATNIEGGTRFGYSLLWVLLWSNAMAILIQYLSAKLGIATGRTLPQNCRAHFSRRMNFGLWIAAEGAALATDLAEFLGAALGFYLLFGPALAARGLSKPSILLIAALLTSVFVFLLLAIELYGFRKLEYVIMGFVVAIAA